MHTLDQLSSRQAYTRLFTDAQFWTPYVNQVCARHGIPCRRVKGGIPGTYPVFIVDRRVVIKFFGVLFNGERSFAVERSIGQLLAENPQIPAAALLGEGSLDPEGGDWPWPYLIYKFLDGQSYVEVRHRLSQPEKLSLAAELGRWAHNLHTLPLPQGGPFEKDWSGYAAFLAGQRAGCASRHAAWGSLPDRMVSEVKEYLPTIHELIDFGARPHIVHADLTGDHLLGKITRGRWITRGLIDFSDARGANLYYELPALHLDFFQGDRSLLRAFLDHYGFVPPSDFPRRALSYCLLHEFNLFSSPLFQTGLLAKCKSLENLADNLWQC